MENRNAVALVLTPDGKFDPFEIGSILHRQKGAPHDFFIIALDASLEVPAPLGKMAKKVIRADRQEPIGKILNEVLALTQSDQLVFLSSRVMPTHDHWLKRICAPLIDGRADAAFGREIPAPGGNYFITEDIKRNFPLSGSSASANSAWAKLFSMDNCAIRRDALIGNPFSEKPLHDAVAAWSFKSGGVPAYCPEALVMRHADSSLKEIFAENRRRGADHALLGGDRIFPETVRMATASMWRDLRFCLSLKKPQHMWYPFLYRPAIFFGYRAGWRLNFTNR